MVTYNSLLHEYYPLCDENDISRESLKLFLFELCNEENINLYLELDNEINKTIYDKFIIGVKRLFNHEPLNYILGYSYFYGYKLKVNQNVLIPRYETEELVSLILAHIDEYYKDKDITIIDVGTGSGAIALALKKEEPRLNIYASDISSEALDIAKENFKNNDIDIKLLKGDMLEPYIKHNIKADILVSNPPYIPLEETIEDSVYDYEPHVALFGGDDGLKYYHDIFKNYQQVMKDEGLLFFEIGYNQKEKLEILIKKYFKNYESKVFKDINGKDRMLMIKFYLH